MIISKKSILCVLITGLFPCCAAKPVALAAGCKAQSKVQKGKLLMLAFIERISILRIVAESQGDKFLNFKDKAAGHVVSKLVEEGQWGIL